MMKKNPMPEFIESPIEELWEGCHILKVAGKPFRCECGCNVFKHLSVDRTRYKCNACDAIYQSE